MQFFIDHFYSEQSFNAYFQKAENNKDLPIHKSILSLKAAFLDFELGMDALAEAETIEVQGQDIYLFLIFLELRAKLSIAMGRLSEGLAILSQIKSIVSEDMPEEYKIIPFTCESCFYFQEGKGDQAELLIEKSLLMLSPLSERYQYLLLDFAMNLSLQCRLSPMKEKIAKINIETNDLSIRSFSNLILYIDSLNRCDLDFAFVLESNLESQAHCFKPYQKEIKNAQKMSSLLKYSQGLINENELIMQLWDKKSDHILVYLELLKKRPNEAFSLIQKSVEDNEEYFKKDEMTVFLPISVELSCGHLEVARALLNRKIKNGSHHFFDHLFWARIEFLSGNIEIALSYFKTVYEDCLKNDCISRLDFELEISYELKNKDIKLFWEYAKNPLTKSNNIAVVGVEKSEWHHDMLGDSPELNAVFENIKKFATLDLPVLIVGETGTGKELTAQALHNESPRKNKSFLAINCGAISESLLQSELFGYEQGAFTGASKSKIGILEEAGDGTVFLDEIGEISPAIQVALLRVLENNEIRPVGGTKSRLLKCRIITATNASLADLVEHNKFRKDLLYRLQRFQINLPALRERKKDIKAIALYYLAKERKSKVINLSEKFIRIIENYPWPGNIRELRNEMERIALLNDHKTDFTEKELHQEKFLPTILSLNFDNLEEENSEHHEPIREINEVEPSSNVKIRYEEENTVQEKIETLSNESLSNETEEFQRFLNNRNSPLRRKEKLKSIFLKYKNLSRGEVARVMNLALNTAAKDLASLEEEGFIQRIMPTTSARTHYFTITTK